MKKLMSTFAILLMAFSLSYAGEYELIIDLTPCSNYQSTNMDEYDSQLLAFNSTTAYEMLVYASDVVEDLCNEFNGSWLDTGLRIYCRFGGDVYTCTAYRIVSAACGINGVVRLMMEGDANNALKRALDYSSKIFNVSKDGRSYVFTAGTGNY